MILTLEQLETSRSDFNRHNYFIWKILLNMVQKVNMYCYTFKFSYLNRNCQTICFEKVTQIKYYFPLNHQNTQSNYIITK